MENKKKKREEFFNNWISENMPSISLWQGIMDIDFLLSNYQTKKFIFIELKTKWNTVTKFQKDMYSMLHKRLIKTNWSDWWEYKWTNLICFKNENFDDWYCELNWKFIKEHELVYKLQDLLWLK